MNSTSRNITFSILKGIAIILVVLGHSGAPHFLSSFAYMMHVPIFFLCAGYFFKIENVNNGSTYLKRRITGLYFPFLRWSIAFLLLHNLWFFVGVLNEEVGNGASVLHPYDWSAFSQRLWNIVSNMSGYDEFLAGTFWFFRAFFIASLVFWVIMWVLNKCSYFSTNERRGWTMVGLSFLLILWMLTTNLRISGVSQGGYRELTGLLFISLGFLFHAYEEKLPANWKITIFYGLLLILSALYWHSSMKPFATLNEFLALPLPALVGFLFWVNISRGIAKKESKVRKLLIYIGDNTLYVFAFHFLAFKLVSILKIAILGLSWEQLGAHPVIPVSSHFDPFFLLYTLVGVALPLLIQRLWSIGMAEVKIPYDHIFSSLMIGLVFIGRKIFFVLKNIGNIGRRIWESLKEIGRMLKEASRASEE